MLINPLSSVADSFIAIFSVLPLPIKAFFSLSLGVFFSVSLIILFFRLK